MNYDAVLTSSMARLQQAQAAQVSSLAAVRSAESLVLSPSLFPTDTVSLGGPGLDLGLIPDPGRPGRMGLPDFAGNQDAYFQNLMEQMMRLKAAQAMLGIQPGSGSDSSAEKGDLKVTAGERRDGTKAKKVTVHKKGQWSTRQYDDNVGGYRKHESTYENGEVGETYQVRVEWEDGQTTIRDVTLEEPGQQVFIDTLY